MKKLAIMLICALMAVCALSACSACSKPASLEITAPTQSTYLIGTEEIDLSGAKVGVKYSNGSVRDTVDITKDMLSEYDLSETGKHEIKITYQELVGVMTVHVVDENSAISAGDSITISKTPTIDKYGVVATVGNIDLRGGEITHHRTSGVEHIIDMHNNPNVKVAKFSWENGKVDIEYRGLKTSYDVEIDVDINVYVSINKLPNKTEYAKNATIEDISFEGGKINVELGGNKAIVVDMDSDVVAQSIDVENGIITFLYNATKHGIDYANVYAEGYFKIDVVDSWVTAMSVKDMPTRKAYSAESLMAESLDIDLSGGTLDLTFNVGANQVIDMTDERISIIDCVFNSDNMLKATITIEYNDTISTARKIRTSFIVDVIEHSPITKLAYYAEQLRLYGSLNDRWTGDTEVGYKPFDENLTDYAIKGFEIYSTDPTINANLASRRKYEADGKVVANAAFYVGYLEYIKDADLFYPNLDRVTNDYTYATEFIAYCDMVTANILQFIAPYNDALIGSFVLVTTPSQTTTISNVTADLRSSYGRVSAALSELYKKVISDAKDILDLFGTQPLTQPTNQEIDDAYDIFYKIYPSVGGVKYLLASILQEWRWDCVDIIYDYYYDADKALTAVNEIKYLIDNDVFPYYVNEIVLAGQNAFRSFDRGMLTLFTKYSLDFLEAKDVLTSGSYQYTVAPKLFEHARFVVEFSDYYYDQEKENKREEKIYSVKDADAILDIMYGERYDNYLLILVESPQFMEFFEEYVVFLQEYLVGIDFSDSRTSERMEKFLQQFKEFSAVEQYIFIYVDTFYGSEERVSHFEMFLQYYYVSSLSDNQLDYFVKMWEAWNRRIALENGDITEERVNEFIEYYESDYRQAKNKVANDIGFDNLFADMIDYVDTSYTELKALPKDLYTLVSKISETAVYKDRYMPDNNTRDERFGIVFVQRYLELVDLVEVWEQETGKNIRGLTNKFKGESVSDLYRAIETVYESEFEALEGNQLFERIRESFIKWFYKSTQTEYIESGDFEDDITSIMDDFFAIADVQEKLLVFQGSFRALLEMSYSNFSDQGMSEDELGLYVQLYYTYRYYLYANEFVNGAVEYQPYVEFFNQTMEGMESEDEEGNPIYLDGAIGMYDDLLQDGGALSQLFIDAGLENLYLTMKALYDTFNA